jgi:hypothetical protein
MLGLVGARLPRPYYQTRQHRDFYFIVKYGKLFSIKQQIIDGNE